MQLFQFTIPTVQIFVQKSFELHFLLDSPRSAHLLSAEVRRGIKDLKNKYCYKHRRYLVKVFGGGSWMITRWRERESHREMRLETVCRKRERKIFEIPREQSYMWPCLMFVIRSGGL